MAEVRKVPAVTRTEVIVVEEEKFVLEINQAQLNKLSSLLGRISGGDVDIFPLFNKVRSFVTETFEVEGFQGNSLPTIHLRKREDDLW